MESYKAINKIKQWRSLRSDMEWLSVHIVRWIKQSTEEFILYVTFYVKKGKILIYISGNFAKRNKGKINQKPTELVTYKRNEKHVYVRKNKYH